MFDKKAHMKRKYEENKRRLVVIRAERARLLKTQWEVMDDPQVIEHYQTLTVSKALTILSYQNDA